MDWNFLRNGIKTVAGIAHGSRALGAPLQANLDLTNRCNVRCIHCYYYSPFALQPNYPDVRSAHLAGRQYTGDDAAVRRRQQEEMSNANARQLIDDLLRMGTRRFQLSGLGEFFLHAHCVDFIRQIKRMDGYCLANTNGTLLDKPLIDELVRLQFDDLRITVMAGDEEMYAKTHAGVAEGTFARLREALLYLAARKKMAASRKPKVAIICIVIAENAGGLEAFTRFAQSVSADSVWFRPFDDVGDTGLRAIAPSEDQAADIRRRLAGIARELSANKVSHNIPMFLQVFQRQLDTHELYRHIPCYLGWLSVRVQANGDVYPCCRCYRSLGNIYHEDFADIWFGKTYREFRRQAIALPERKQAVSQCDCYSCVHHIANLRVYRLLHPWCNTDRFAGDLCSDDGD